jgi:hypothetical protein
MLLMVNCPSKSNLTVISIFFHNNTFTLNSLFQTHIWLLANAGNDNIYFPN